MTSLPRRLSSRSTDPVVFSRAETLYGPDEQEKDEREHGVPNAVAALIHQSDEHGQQQQLVRPPEEISHADESEEIKPKRSFLMSLFCCVNKDPRDAAYAAPARKPLPPAGSKFLLPEQLESDKGKKTLVLDLDETLVHSSFKPIPDPDFVIPVNLDGIVHHVYVRKRPGVEHFLEKVGRKFEVVVYTASLAKYADPLLDQLDRHTVVRSRLFREHCVMFGGNFVKDLAKLGRPLDSVIIVDNSPLSYLFQPQNAIGCTSFIEDIHDRELLHIANYLDTIVDVDDVCKYLHLWRSPMP